MLGPTEKVWYLGEIFWKTYNYKRICSSQNKAYGFWVNKLKIFESHLWKKNRLDAQARVGCFWGNIFQHIFFLFIIEKNIFKPNNARFLYTMNFKKVEESLCKWPQKNPGPIF